MIFGTGRRFRLPTPFGGDEENRTPDPLLARQVLSQLSYTPMSSPQSPLVPLPDESESFTRSLASPLHSKPALLGFEMSEPLAGLRKYFHSFHFLKVHNLSIAPSKLNNDTCKSELD